MPVRKDFTCTVTDNDTIKEVMESSCIANLNRVIIIFIQKQLVTLFGAHSA